MGSGYPSVDMKFTASISLIVVSYWPVSLQLGIIIIKSLRSTVTNRIGFRLLFFSLAGISPIQGSKCYGIISYL